MPAVLPYREFYHYTSFEGLLGIARTRTLWATSVHYLNDDEEFRFGHRIISQDLERIAKSTPGSKLVRTLIDSFRGWEKPYVFVFSFSEVGDLLSQWRGYCPKGTGISVGFPEPLITTRAQRQAFQFLPCIYDQSAQEDAVLRLLHAAVTEEAYHGGPFDELRSQYLFALMTLAPRLKHHSFAEEREWRLISRPLMAGDARVAFRARESMLVPYFTFSLADEGLDLEFGNVYIGPNPHVDLAANAVGDLLYATPGVTCAAILRSDTPYRSW
jgi:hypothetical protein